MAARPALKSWWRNDAGATAVEYGLIISLIFLIIVGAVSAFGHNTTNLMNSVASNVAGAM
jgi:pilus assembly protein Flp/PilA